MYTIPQILSLAGVKYENYPKWPMKTIYLTGANQLIGTYADLRRFQTSSPDYFGWDVHHIVEAQDLGRLGVEHLCPPYEQQVCVLIPRTAHSRRINSIFRSQNPTNVQVTASDLRSAYRDAYWLIGDYCGGGEKSIREELVNVVLAVFRSAGL
jgi:hypothetical protein